MSRVVLLFLWCSVIVSSVRAQDIAVQHDSTTIHTGRLIGVAATHTIATAATLYALNEVWYKNYERTGFHVRSDIKVWNQVDKLGHAYSTYSLAGPISDAYRWAGVDRKKSALIGAGSSFIFLGIIEFLDAYSAQWGFSYGDMGANVVGSGMFLAQELAWEEQRIQLKYSYHARHYQPYFKAWTDDIYGTSLPERMLKDYNAQTYWLSVSVHSFGVDWWPKWLNMAVGYGADDMYGAYHNSWKDAKGKYYDANHIPRYRQLYLSPDINLAAINTKSKLLNTVLDRLTIKIPAPTIEFNTRGKVIFRPLYF